MSAFISHPELFALLKVHVFQFLFNSMGQEKGFIFVLFHLITSKLFIYLLPFKLSSFDFKFTLFSKSLTEV